MLRFIHLSITCLTISMLALGCDDPQNSTPSASEDAPVAMPGNPGMPTSTPPASSRPATDNNTPAASSPAPQPPEDPTRAQFAGLAGPIPATWQWQPPQHHFRVAQWMIPGRENSDPGELVVTTFPEASGNNIENNIERWTQQFRSNDGSPSRPEVTSKTVNGLPVTIVDLKGEYLGMGGGWHKENYRMLVTIVQAPVGSVFIKFLGPDAAVDANATEYLNLIDNLVVETPSSK
ncbi:MAG: hypothetical protein MK089_10795 [Phycisphaerales bacterium]|nr:hypothetical protein [Phycisphaerales bacterium]